MINIFIQCRIYSSRLRGKALINFFGIKIVERIILIAKKTSFKKEIFLITGSEKKNYQLNKIAKKHNIKIFFGSETNVFKRYCDAIEFFSLNKDDDIMRLTADNYLIQPIILNKLSKFIKKYDYIYVDPISHFSGELFKTTSLLNKIKRKNISFNTKEHVTYNFRKMKNIKVKKLSNKLFGINHNCKITLDTDKDLKFLKKIENNSEFKKLNCISALKKITNSKNLTHDTEPIKDIKRKMYEITFDYFR